MNRILIIAREAEFREGCRSAFRQSGARVLTRAEIVDALIELNWFTPSLIIWAIDPRKVSDLKALGVLRERYGKIPLLLHSANEQILSLSEMAELVMPGYSPIGKIVAKAHHLLGEPVPVGNVRSRHEPTPDGSGRPLT